MARIRTIKPEFFTSEDIVALLPLDRLLYIALWCEADRDGRFVWKPKTFKIRYFPEDDCDIEAMCEALRRADLVRVYECDGTTYAYIPTFAAHQHINAREAASQLPEPTPDRFKKPTRQPRVNDASTTREPHVPHVHGGREGKGRERKGRERGECEGETHRNGVSPQHPFEPPDREQVAAFLAEIGKPDAISPDRFLSYYTERGWEKGSKPMRDWKLTVRNWIADDEKKNPPRPKIDHEAYPVQ